MNKNTHQTHQELLQFIDILLSVEFDTILRFKCRDLITKYGNKLLNHTSAREELVSVIKLSVVNIEQMIAKKFKKQLYQYFTESGFYKYLYALIQSECHKFISDQLASIESKRGTLI